jgi:hypothetical protein
MAKPLQQMHLNISLGELSIRRGNPGERLSPAETSVMSLSTLAMRLRLLANEIQERSKGQ